MNTVQLFCEICDIWAGDQDSTGDSSNRSEAHGLVFTDWPNQRDRLFFFRNVHNEDTDVRKHIE